MRFIPLILFTFLISTTRAQLPLKLVSREIHLSSKKSFSLKMPEGYNISVAAEGLERPRFFAKSPDGRIFITDMHDRTDNKQGRVLILENWDEEKRSFQKISTYLDFLHNPNQVAFYTSNDTTYIYVAETGRLSFYQYNNGDTLPASKPTVIARFPDYGLDYKYGGWHLTRSLAFHNRKLYVSVGSSCDACIEKESIRASIIEMNPDGSDQKMFAWGIRNAVGIKWVNNKLWITHMGRDNRGPDQPEELFQSVERNRFYGWPYYYQYNKKIISDTAFAKWIPYTHVAKPSLAEYGFRAHSAPLGFEYFNEFSDPLLNNSFLVALHGSTSVWRERGNAIVQLLPNGKYREFITGFLQGKTEDERFGRPCDIYRRDDHSFFFSDDKNGVIYYVWKEKE